MNSFLKDNRIIILIIVIGIMLLVSILAYAQNNFILNDNFQNYCKTGFGGFIACFIVSYMGIFGKNYNIDESPRLLRASNTFFFILGAMGFMGSTAYMIYVNNAMAIPDYFFGSCGAVVATALQEKWC